MKFREYYLLEDSQEIERCNKILNEEPLGSGLAALGTGAASAGGTLLKIAGVGLGVIGALGPLGIGVTLASVLGASQWNNIKKWFRTRPINMSSSDLKAMKANNVTKSVYDKLFSMMTPDYAKYKTIEKRSPFLFKTLRTSELRKNLWIYAYQPIKIPDSIREEFAHKFGLKGDWNVVDMSLYRTTNGGKIYLLVAIDNLKEESINRYNAIIEKMRVYEDDESAFSKAYNAMTGKGTYSDTEEDDVAKTPQLQLLKNAKFFISVDSNAEKWVVEKMHMNLRQLIISNTPISKDYLTQQIDALNKEIDAELAKNDGNASNPSGSGSNPSGSGSSKKVDIFKDTDFENLVTVNVNSKKLNSINGNLTIYETVPVDGGTIFIYKESADYIYIVKINDNETIICTSKTADNLFSDLQHKPLKNMYSDIINNCKKKLIKDYNEQHNNSSKDTSSDDTETTNGDSENQEQSSQGQSSKDENVDSLDIENKSDIKSYYNKIPELKPLIDSAKLVVQNQHSNILYTSSGNEVTGDYTIDSILEKLKKIGVLKNDGTVVNFQRLNSIMSNIYNYIKNHEKSKSTINTIDNNNSNGRALVDKSTSVDKSVASSNSKETPKKDDIFEEVARLVVSRKMASMSLLQRQFKITRTKALNIMNQLHNAGIVGASNGNKPRDVLVKNEDELNNILKNM